MAEAREPETGPASLRWSVERRLAFIAQRLLWEGRINRADIVSHFGVSPNQASADLRRFEAAHPAALAYDTRARTYRAGPGLPRPAEADAARLLRELRLMAEGVLAADEAMLAQPPAVGLAEAPARRVDPQVLAAVLSAIRERRGLAVSYRSFSSGDVRPRLIAPHALIFDGFRWHARAHDGDQDAFRDFVLGRMGAAALEGPAARGAEQDADWNRRVRLRVEPHPALTAIQRETIAIDYGMTGFRLELVARRALVWYLRRRLGLLPGHERMAPGDQHIVLVEETELG